MKSDQQTTAGSSEFTEDPAAIQLKLDIEQTRADMSATISALETRLSPAEVREKVGVELQHVEDRVRVVVREQLAEAKTLVQGELVEAKNLLRGEMNEAEERLKRGLGEAKESVKKELHDAFTGARESVRAATLGKVEDLATNLGDKMNNTRDTLVDTIRNNPVPATVMGVGLVWLLMNRSKSAAHRRAHSEGRHDASSSVRRWEDEGGSFRPGVGERSSYEGDPSTSGETGSAMGQAGAAVGKVVHQASDAVGQGLHQASDAAGKALQGASDGAMTLAHQASDTAAHLAHQAGDAAISIAGSGRQGAKRVEQGFQQALQENPMVVGAAALAVGALVGFSLPRTHGEDVLMGAARDGVLHRAGNAVHDATASIAQLAEQNLEQVKSALNETSKETQESSGTGPSK